MLAEIYESSLDGETSYLPKATPNEGVSNSIMQKICCPCGSSLPARYITDMVQVEIKLHLPQGVLQLCVCLLLAFAMGSCGFVINMVVLSYIYRSYDDVCLNYVTASYYCKWHFLPLLKIKVIKN